MFNFKSLVDNIRETLNAGLTDSQASVSTREPVAALKSKKTKRAEPIAIVITAAMLAGRMKLPARVFTKGTKVNIDGHVITQQEADQGRSTKFNPEIFGFAVKEGDTMIFTHEGGRDWSVNVEKGRGRHATTSKKAAPVVTSKASKTKAKTGSAKRSRVVEDDDDDDEDEAPAPKRSSKASKSKGNGKATAKAEAKPARDKRLAHTEPSKRAIADGISYFGEIALANANDDDFEENENIKETGAFEDDARIYFTTPQNMKFKAWRKRMGLTLRKSVELLNGEVFE